MYVSDTQEKTLRYLYEALGAQPIKVDLRRANGLLPIEISEFADGTAVLKRRNDDRAPIDVTKLGA